MCKFYKFIITVCWAEHVSGAKIRTKKGQNRVSRSETLGGLERMQWGGSGARSGKLRSGNGAESGLNRALIVCWKLTIMTDVIRHIYTLTVHRLQYAADTLQSLFFNGLFKGKRSTGRHANTPTTCELADNEPTRRLVRFKSGKKLLRNCTISKLLIWLFQKQISL